MILLDTQALIWWISDPDKLSKRAVKVIEHEQQKGTLLVSSISVWEIYMLVVKGRIKLSMDIETWILEIEKLPYVQIVPVNNRIAGKSVTLPGEFHSDPADRIIVATAREYGVSVVTKDERILQYTEVQSIW